MIEGGSSRNFHDTRFSHHVETAQEVFWRRDNPLELALISCKNEIDRLVSLPDKDFEDEDEDEDEEGVLPPVEKRRELLERLLRDVYKCCDGYLFAYFDHVIAAQTRDDRSTIEDTDRARRFAHIALTNSLGILFRNAKKFGIIFSSLEDYVISNPMDEKRIVIGNFALHLSFQKYISA